MKIVTLLLGILVLSSCTNTTEYVKTCKFQTVVELHGNSKSDLFQNAVPQANIRCPF